MQKLLEGIHQFQSSVFSDHQELFERLAEGQSPETLFITCSDSRISPSLLTQTKPGELFILRNAGNMVPAYNVAASSEAATIEYAVAVLGVRDIIVCGHSHCGAMKGLLEPAGLDDVPAVAAWLKNAECTRRILQENYKNLQGTALMSACVQENVLSQLENIRTHPSVYARLARKELTLHAWVYKIETGEVFSYDPAVGQFQLLSEAKGVPDETPVNRLAAVSI